MLDNERLGSKKSLKNILKSEFMENKHSAWKGWDKRPDIIQHKHRNVNRSKPKKNEGYSFLMFHGLFHTLERRKVGSMMKQTYWCDIAQITISTFYHHLSHVLSCQRSDEGLWCVLKAFYDGLPGFNLSLRDPLGHGLNGLMAAVEPTHHKEALHP